MQSVPILITDCPPMIFADGAYDGKPQAVAFYLFRRMVEAVEYQPGIQRRLIGGVRYCKFPVRHGKVYFTSRAVVSDGIDHKVVHEAFQQGAVGADGQAAVRELFIEENVARDAFQKRRLLFEEAGQVDVLHLSVLAVVYLGKQQQVAVQPGEAGDVFIKGPV